MSATRKARHRQSQPPPQPRASTLPTPRLTVGTHVIDGVVIEVVTPIEMGRLNGQTCTLLLDDLDGATLDLADSEDTR